MSNLHYKDHQHEYCLLYGNPSNDHNDSCKTGLNILASRVIHMYDEPSWDNACMTSTKMAYFKLVANQQPQITHVEKANLKTIDTRSESLLASNLKQLLPNHEIHQPHSYTLEDNIAAIRDLNIA